MLKGFGHTKIITAHDLVLIWELCPRTLVLKEGRLLKDGPTRDLLTDPGLMEEAGLEVPLDPIAAAIFREMEWKTKNGINNLHP